MVSTKCFYDFKKGPTEKEISDGEIKQNMKALQEKYKNSLGYRKMAECLESEYNINRSAMTVLRLARESSTLSAVRRKHFTEEYYITRREMQDYAPSDLIKRNFFSLSPRRRFVCDITYLTGCDETWYLSAIEDLFNGEIVAYVIGEHCNAELCIDTVQVMIETIKDVQGSILHSDGGSTYIAYEYRELLSRNGIVQSMGVKRTCFDNARMESFNGVFKTEALYAHFGKTKVKNRTIPVRELAAEAEWFIPYYNKKRKKVALGHLSPEEYRQANPNGTYPMIFSDR